MENIQYLFMGVIMRQIVCYLLNFIFSANGKTIKFFTQEFPILGTIFGIYSIYTGTISGILPMTLGFFMFDFISLGKLLYKGFNKCPK